MLHAQARSAEDMVSLAAQELLRKDALKPGDVLGVVAGTRLASGSTNFMRLHVVTAGEAREPARQKARRPFHGKKK